MTIRVLVVVSVLAAAACGGDDNTKDPNVTVTDPTGVQVAFDPGAVTVKQGASQAVTANLTRTGAAVGQQVTFVTSALPSGVTVTADTTAGDSGTLTIAADTTAAPQTFTLTVIASIGGQGGTATLDVTIAAATTLTLDATVVNGPLGPLSSGTLEVWSAGSDTPAYAPITDGHVTMSNIIAPYDLAIDNGAAKSVTIGMTTAPSRILSLMSIPSSAASVEVTGTITNALADAGSTATLVSVACDVGNGNVTETGAGQNSFDLLIQGPALPPFDCVVRLLRYHHEVGLYAPTFIGAAQQTIHVSSLTTVVPAMTLAALTTNTVTVTLDQLDPLATLQVATTFSVPGQGGNTLAASSPPVGTTTFTMTAPADANWPIVVDVSAQSSALDLSVARATLPHDVTTLTVPMPVAISTVTPLSGEADVDPASDPFIASAPGFYAHTFFAGGHTGYGIFTASPEVTPAMMQRYGIHLAAGTPYTWRATQLSAIDSPDAIEDPNNIDSIVSYNAAVIGATRSTVFTTAE